MTLRFLQDDATFSSDEVKSVTDRLLPYREYLRRVIENKSYSDREASLFLPNDTAYFEKTKETAYAYQSRDLRFVIVVGIGGSNLGTKAIYDALLEERLNRKKKFPQLLFLETVNTPEFEDIIKRIESITSPDEVLVNVISKSGTTTETIACFEALYAYLADRFEHDAKFRVVVTTDEGSLLDVRAKELGISALHIPKNVGGRFSVFSAVGVFPLLLAGIDVPGLLHGAREAQMTCLKDGAGEDHALRSAALIAEARAKGLGILNTFFFVPEFESIGKWLRQLIGESLGKRIDRNEEEARAGITPIVSIGTTDLHSVGQLYFGGPKDKFTSFVYAPAAKEVHPPKKGLLNMPIAGISEKGVNEILEAIYQGVKETYKKEELPFTETLLAGRDAASVGAYMQTKMLEVMYLGEAWNINAFDQPEVESYKIAAKKILERPGT